MKRRKRVYAYITHGARLLVFEHVGNPEAGVQVPAGTVEPGESPDTAVLREAWEETGLEGLRLAAPLGDFEHDMREFGVAEHQHAHFFHLRCRRTPPTRWVHNEIDTATGGAVPFELYWVPVDRPPPLIALCGARLDHLRDRLDP